MTKLEKLIKELCPNGVEYRKLGEIATISRGGNFQKKDFCEKGIPCIHYGQIYTRYGLFADKTLTFINEDAAKKQKYAVKNDLVMAVTSENIDDVCKCVAWLGEDSIAISGHTAIIHHNQNPKYLCYYFHTAMFHAQKKKLAHGTKVIEVTPDHLSNITIPVPPLGIQSEIVRILDEYSASVSALQQKLEAELTARKKQYEYYRDLLLDFGVHGGGTSECEWRTLGEIAKFRRGSFPQPYGNPEWYGGENAMPFVQVADVEESGMLLCSETKQSISEIAQPKSIFVPKGTVICSIQGSIGRVAITQYDCYVDRTLAIFEEYKIEINKRYFAYQIQRKFGVEKEFARGSTLKTITKDEFSKFEIPIPPLEEQTRIVNILDRFDKLCNDISEGLPAEIEARRKQYEYYRDKLLSFKEM